MTRKGTTLNLRTYQAHSLTEALTRIKSDLGDDAVILHSRTFRRGGMLGLGGQIIYEVTASLPAPRPRASADGLRKAAATTRPRESARAAETGPDPARAAAIALALAEQDRRRRPVSAPAVEPKPPSSTKTAPRVEPSPVAAPTPATPATPRAQRHSASHSAESQPVLPVARRFVLAADPAATAVRADSAVRTTPRPEQAAAAPPKAPAPAPVPRFTSNRAAARRAAPAAAPARTDPALRDEIAALKQMVGQVLQRQAGTLQSAMPEALFNEYVSLIQSEVAQEIADELCDAVRRELVESQLSDASLVRASFRRHLAGYVPVAPDSLLARPMDGRPFTIALVGPTGVGKTTTVAKLAAAFKLRHNRRVGLITTDTYRIAAVDQLRTYANIIGIPLKVTLSPEEMGQACESLRHCDVILIDTAGRSPNDAPRLDEIRAFAAAANPHEVHLVLSSTYSEQVLMRTIERFSAVKTDRVIFTKTDEAVSLGVLINVMRKAGKELSFITTGQEVPDHIEAGSPDRLAALVLGEKG